MEWPASGNRIFEKQIFKDLLFDDRFGNYALDVLNFQIYIENRDLVFVQLDQGVRLRCTQAETGSLFE